MAQTKRRINIALPPGLLDRVDAECLLHGFESRGEFMGKAVEFYLGFLQANNCDEYIHSTILTSMGDKLKLLEARMCKQLFRLCVELSMVEHFFAAQMDMLDDPADLQRLPQWYTLDKWRNGKEIDKTGFALVFDVSDLLLLSFLDRHTRSGIDEQLGTVPGAKRPRYRSGFSMKGRISMKIKRDGDAIHYQHEDGDSGNVIGGVATPIFAVAVAEDADMERYWSHCARRIQPSAQTATQVLRWAQETFDLEPLPTAHMKMALQRANLAANLFPDRYSEPHFSSEMSDEEIERSLLTGHARRQAAMEASDEDLGIRLRGFRLPDTPRNRPLYEEGRRFMEEHYPHHPEPPPDPKAVVREADPCVFVEETQEHISGDGLAAFSLARHMAKRMGVSAEDIATRSPRFMGYVYVLVEEGKLPTMQQFLAEG